VETDTDLPEIIEALRATRRLAGLLDSRQQKASETADDGDDHEHLDQRGSANAAAAAERLVRSTNTIATGGHDNAILRGGRSSN
jgi:hypothetical protein